MWMMHETILYNAWINIYKLKRMSKWELHINNDKQTQQ
jgi:hypothetical protein